MDDRILRFSAGRFQEREDLEGDRQAFSSRRFISSARPNPLSFALYERSTRRGVSGKQFCRAWNPFLTLSSYFPCVSGTVK